MVQSRGDTSDLYPDASHGLKDAAAGDPAAPLINGRPIVVTVPDDARPGESDFEVNTDTGKLLKFLVPKDAKPGDRLRITRRATDGKWSCDIATRVASAGPATEQDEKAGALIGEEPDFIVRVPEGATPGVTKLEVKLDTGTALRVLIPDSAQPGDRLGLTRDWVGWNVQILRGEGPAVAPSTRTPVSTMASVKLTNADVDPEASYRGLVEAARKAGSFVSEKLARAAVPPSGMVGIVALEPVEAGEELLRIPAKLHLSPGTARVAMPELFDQVSSLATLTPRLRKEVGRVVFVARLLVQAIARLSAGVEAVPDGSDVSVWAFYADALVGENFEGHPHWRSLEDAAQVRAFLSPSPEWEHMETMSKEVINAHRVIVQGIPQLLQEGVEPGIYLQARLCMLTREFNTSNFASLVPVVDLMNHSADAGADWKFNEETLEMVVTANRRHAAGEQVFISYGYRPNPLLFRTYGFTLPPGEEPSWAYVLQGDKPRALYDAYLPREDGELNIHFDSKVLQDSLIEALNKSYTFGPDPCDFLRDFCTHCRKRYEEDESLCTALAALRKVRLARPSNPAWWSAMPADFKGEGVLAAADSLWAEACLRTKMSEYLCLTTYLEVVEFEAGRLPEAECLDGTETIRAILVEAIAELRRVGSFVCLSSPDPEAGGGDGGSAPPPS